jgi:S-adenosylmethionine-diacylgycerolhomoserine-N-methlytransferase
MEIGGNGSGAEAQVSRIRNFYRFHARIYEATRWAFLFGRHRLIRHLNLERFSNKTVLEVGCGTGHNLLRLAANYPNLQLIGLDISPEMLRIASKRLKGYSDRILLVEKPYTSIESALPLKPDIILFSYSLSMFNPGWEAGLQRAFDQLDKGGLIAVVDFHASPIRLFLRWMDIYHVRLDKHLLPVLENRYKPLHKSVCRAYGGLWSYFLFLGQKQ